MIDVGPLPFASHVTACVDGGRWQEYTYSTTSSTTRDEVDTDPETAAELHRGRRHMHGRFSPWDTAGKPRTSAAASPKPPCRVATSPARRTRLRSSRKHVRTHMDPKSQYHDISRSCPLGPSRETPRQTNGSNRSSSQSSFRL